VRVFVFGYNRYDSMTTSLILERENIPHTVLVHTEEAKHLFVKHGTAKAERITVTNNPRGLGIQRNTALEMMADGEWGLFLVDDLKELSELRNYDRVTEPALPITERNQKHYAERFKNPITATTFLRRAEQLAKKCDSHSGHLGGFCAINNPLFRKKHWSFNVLADGRALVIRKTHLRFDPVVQTIDDYGFTALNIRTFGLVVVNQWVLPDCKRYSEGGYGSLNERMPQKLADAKYLVDNFPDIVAYRDKPGHPYGSHIAIRQRNKPKHLMNRR